MQIMNSGATMAALGELKKNDTTLGKELKKVASGMKVNSAGDGASEYAISEKMRVRLRSLDQDIENVQTGKNLVRTAEGGIQEIVNNLRSMKTMAIDSANDHNTDTDRATIDKEFQQRIEEIDDIANTTNYNGRLLLRGDYGDHYLYKNRPEGSSTVLSLSATSISSDGVYTLPVGFTGTVYVSGGQNIELRQEDSSTPLHDVYIVGPSGGNANIWLNGLNIENGNDASIIKFQGTDNHLTILGTNNINYLPRDDYNKAVINVGGGLTIEGTGTLNVKNTGIQSCAGIGTDQDEYTSPDITINSGTYNIEINNDGAAIGGSAKSTVGNITINGGTFYLKSRTGAGIGGTGVSFGDATPYRAKVSDTGAITIGKDAIISAESEWALEKYYTPLVIHHGTKANQATNIFIKDMRSASLGLDNVNVLTRDESSLALFTLDVAINYALDNQTRMGAYQSRLDYTVSNLTTSNENTQSSESTIRDANMAKEMTEYTKANVLAQSAQAMLAQANQNASSVLELLQ